MKFKDFIRKTMFYLTVPSCVGCGEKLSVNETALCSSCLQSHLLLKSRDCSRCFNTYDKCACTNKHLRNHKIKRMIKIFRYIQDESGSPSNNLIYTLKRNNRRDVVDFLADELTRSIKFSLPDFQEFMITNVPRRPSAIRKYGYDHAAVLAKAIAKRLGIEYKSLLKSKTKKAQKKLTYTERRENARTLAKKSFDLKGKRIIILDDVVTTGSSLSSAADVLKSLGAKELVGASVSVAYKDEYTPFPKSEYVYW